MRHDHTLKTCLKCIAVDLKCLDGIILIYLKLFLNIMFIKSAKDREMKIFVLNRAIYFFLQVKFRSFLEILETFEKTVFLTVFKITVMKTNISKIL